MSLAHVEIESVLPVALLSTACTQITCRMVVLAWHAQDMPRDFSPTANDGEVDGCLT